MELQGDDSSTSRLPETVKMVMTPGAAAIGGQQIKTSLPNSAGTIFHYALKDF